MKNKLLTISVTTVLLLAGQSAMALSEDSSGFELLTGNPNLQDSVAYNQSNQRLEMPRASFIEQLDETSINQMGAVDFLKAENTHQ